MDFGNIKSIEIPEGVVKQIEVNGVIVWQAGGRTYTPLLPDDLETYPLYLKGWAKYTLNRITSLGSSGTVALADTGVRALYPSTCFSSAYDGCENSKAMSTQPDKTIKFGYNTDSYRDRVYLKDSDLILAVDDWNDYLAEHPIDILFLPETINDSVRFAVTDGTNFGYYNPTDQEFCAVYGMTGTVIERCEYVSFDGDSYVTTGYQLTGADTVEIDFEYTKSGSNIFGSWHSDNENVFTLYASTGSSYVRYASSLYRNTPVPTNERLTFRMTPTGDYVDGTRYHTWAQDGFITGTPCIVGWLDGSGSPKLKGDVYEFVIEGHVHLVPVKVGTAFYLFDIMRWEMPAHSGTLGGGAVISETIPFPSEIPDAPVLMMMGGPEG